MKERSMNDPEESLWDSIEDIDEMKSIFLHLKSLTYYDKPNYGLIRGELQSILRKNPPK